MMFCGIRYTNINDLDAKIERIISRTVLYYYSDWKNHDRPKYMKFKGSSDPNDKKFLLLVRDCGTFIVRTCDIYKDEWATAIFEFYQTESSADYYYINLNEFMVMKVDPEEFRAVLDHKEVAYG